MGGTELEGVASGEEGGVALYLGRTDHCGAWRTLGARPRLGSADWWAVPRSHAPQGRGNGPGSRSLTPPPSAAQLLLVECQVTSCGGPPRALSPAAAAGTPRPLPFPGRRPLRLLQLGAAAFSWKTFAKVFMSFKKNFFLLLTADLLS